MKKNKNFTTKLISTIIAICALIGVGTGILPEDLFLDETGSGKVAAVIQQEENNQASSVNAAAVDLASIPAYSDSPYVVINHNQPDFDEDDITTDSFEYYSELDGLGRCGVTYACLGQDLMPTEDRESISHVKPTGWVQNQYDFVD